MILQGGGFVFCQLVHDCRGIITRDACVLPVDRSDCFTDSVLGILEAVEECSSDLRKVAYGIQLFSIEREDCGEPASSKESGACSLFFEGIANVRDETRIVADRDADGVHCSASGFGCEFFGDAAERD